jgi:FkbM family methyltransferase
MRLLKAHGVNPGTVIDVGVATGTPWLWDAFPDAHLVLIDPTFTAGTSVPGHPTADIIPAAAGATAREMTLHIDQATPGSSSFFTPSKTLLDARAAKGDVRGYRDQIVPVRPLDVLLAEKHLPAPYLLKIDTEGYERDVLLGASETLAQTVVVITETNVAQRFDASYEFAELIALLHGHGFRLFDFVEVRTLGKQGPINYVDAVFVRRQ